MIAGDMRLKAAPIPVGFLGPVSPGALADLGEVALLKEASSPSTRHCRDVLNYTPAR